MRVRQRSVRRRLSLLVVLSTQLSFAPLASAQSTEERASARALAGEGATAFKEQRWQDAIRYFTRAEQLVHAPPHLLYSAKAHLALGHLVEANDLLLMIKNDTLAANAPPAFVHAQEESLTLLQQLNPRMSSLAVDVKNVGEQAFEIHIDSGKLDAMFRGVPKAINPGEHHVSAIADGLRANEVVVQIQEGEKKTVDLEMKPDPSAHLTPLAPPAEASPAAVPAGPAAPASPGPDQGPETSEKPGWLRIAPYAAFGVGAVGLGLGTAFALSSASKRSDADKANSALPTTCANPCRANDPAAEKVASLDNEAGNARTLSVVGFVIGGVGVATGATLLLLDVGGKHEKGAGVHVTPVIGLGRAGVFGVF
jgi:hypothetical protein